ncbi:alpha/beta hydrolase-fold protein [Ottowia thiooxydans]|uniref:Pimeloyl-ACP methyl ester carboxylesterase n=1 Tax=Ottowia thiooxydans TaxID=219182 RepID=A0ABV2QF00_9BURK
MKDVNTRVDAPCAPMCLREIRSFFVGGSVRTLTGLPVEQRRFSQNGPSRGVDPNGDHVSGQMYVQAYLQAQPTRPFPLLLWHGGGMTGANWETTPDGRAGWLTIFLRAGFDVYVSDAVERGRAGWSRWPEIYADAPLHRTLDEGWDMFRIGPRAGYSTQAADRCAYAGQQFPVNAFDTFAAQWVPRWTDHEAQTLAAYDSLLQQVGPCIVLGHSQGGGFSLEATRRRPNSVAGVIAVEPSGAPGAADIHGAAALPAHLLVWGDHIAEHPVWQRYRSNVDAYARALKAAGVQTDICDLPSEGISGNSHFPMMDLNSDAVAARILHWLDSIAPTVPTAPAH